MSTFFPGVNFFCTGLFFVHFNVCVDRIRATRPPVCSAGASESSPWHPESELSSRVHLSVIRRAMPTMWQHLPSDPDSDKGTWRRSGGGDCWSACCLVWFDLLALNRLASPSNILPQRRSYDYKNTRVGAEADVSVLDDSGCLWCVSWGGGTPASRWGSRPLTLLVRMTSTCSSGVQLHRDTIGILSSSAAFGILPEGFKWYISCFFLYWLFSLNSSGEIINRLIDPLKNWPAALKCFLQ